VDEKEQIRRAYYIEGKSIRQIARERRHDRRTIRAAIRDAGPTRYQLTKPRPRLVLGPFVSIINEWLAESEADHGGDNTATGLASELLEAQDQHALGKRLAQLARLDLLIVDEVGFVPFTPEGARLLFQAFSERYLRGSLLVTTNLEFSRWLEVFGDERLTGALLDHLTHHCHVLEFNGDSYRFKESLREQVGK
jgi:transposase